MAEKTETYDGHTDAIYWAYLEKRFRNICTSVKKNTIQSTHLTTECH